MRAEAPDLRNQLSLPASLNRRPPTPPRLQAESLGPPLFYVKSCLPGHQRVGALDGMGPAGSLCSAISLHHPFSIEPEMHPLYRRALDAQLGPHGDLSQLILARLAYWLSKLEELERERTSWLASLQPHARTIYQHTGLHGPGIKAIHIHLRSKGYWDATVA